MNARHTITTEGTVHTLVVRFTKANGTDRRMVCRYYGHTSRKPNLVTVWDIEKGATRTINLDTVEDIKVMPGTPKPIKTRKADVQSRINAIFG